MYMGQSKYEPQWAAPAACSYSQFHESTFRFYQQSGYSSGMNFSGVGNCFRPQADVNVAELMGLTYALNNIQ
jgi:hypothetical protein